MAKHYTTILTTSGHYLSINAIGTSGEEETAATDLEFRLTAADRTSSKPTLASVLNMKEAGELYNFLDTFRSIRDSVHDKVGKIVEVTEGGLSPEIVDAISKDPVAAEKIIVHNMEVVKKVVEHKLEVPEIVGLAHRKNQLNEMRRLLSETDHFSACKKMWKCARDEDTWQHFFQENQWIFGRGLTYAFTSAALEKRLETVTTGSSVVEAGKRVDALLRTRGSISALCYAEIKKHDTKLLASSDYRPGSFRPSVELAGAVSQCQITVEKALKTIGDKLSVKSKLGHLTGEFLYNTAPQSFLVIGSLDEFKDVDGAIHEERYKTFELYRRNIISPSIMTFDELWARASSV